MEQASVIDRKNRGKAGMFRGPICIGQTMIFNIGNYPITMKHSLVFMQFRHRFSAVAVIIVSKSLASHDHTY